VVVVAGLKYAQAFLVPFVFAVFLAILGTAPVKFLKKKRVPTVIAVLLVTLMMVAVFLALGAVLARSSDEFLRNLPRYKTLLTETIRGLRTMLAGYGLETYGDIIFEASNPERVLELTAGAVRGLFETLSQTFLVIVMMIFMLIEAAEFRMKFDLASGPKVDIKRFENTAHDVQRYLGIKTFTSTLTGILIYLWTTAMGVDFPVLWALVAFLFNYVPFIGSIIASIPAILLIVLQYDAASGITLAVGYVVINIGISNFLEPVLMGRRLGLSPLIVFLSLVVWGWIWGPAGALLSVPLTMIVKILLEHSQDFSWIAILMGGRPAVDKKEAVSKT